MHRPARHRRGPARVRHSYIWIWKNNSLAEPPATPSTPRITIARFLSSSSSAPNKWSGIIHMAQAMHTSLDQVVTIGDDTNDLPMLVGARLSFAMGDAKESIKTEANRVTGTHADCGVAQVVDLLLAGEAPSPAAESGLMTPI